MKSSEKIFDIRTIEKKFANNEISKEEYDEFLNALEENKDDYQVIDEEKILKVCGIHTYQKKEELENEE